MEDFDLQLVQYKEESEKLLAKDFSDFEDFRQLELEFCNLINTGSRLRNYLLTNPQLCDNDTYMVLTNKIKDTTVINKKFSSILYILKLQIKLLDYYKVQLETLLKENKFKEAVGIYEQLFQFTRDYNYRKKIADILAKEFDDPKQALGIYKTLEDALKESYEYWDDYSKLATTDTNLNLQEYCKTKREECRLNNLVKEFLDKKNYTQSIKAYEKLFKVTNDYNYKKRIANVYAVCYRNVDKAIDLYKKLINKLGGTATFWWEFSDLYEYNKDTYNQVACMQQAIKIELKQYDREKENN